MSSSDYKPPYYLKIAGIIIKVSLDKNLFLSDDWIYFFNHFLKNHLTRPTTSKLNFRLTEIRSDLLHALQLPHGKKNINFNNLLHPGLFLFYLKHLIRPLLREKNGLLLHASGVLIDHHALLIGGHSGAGKSTALNKLSPFLPPLGDDAIILKIENNKIFAFPSPLNLKAQIDDIQNKGYPIKGIIFPVKNSKLSLVKIRTQLAAMRKIIDLFFNPLNDLPISRLSLLMAKNLSRNTYTLHFSKEDDIVKMITSEFKK